MFNLIQARRTSLSASGMDAATPTLYPEAQGSPIENRKIANAYLKLCRDDALRYDKAIAPRRYGCNWGLRKRQSEKERYEQRSQWGWALVFAKAVRAAARAVGRQVMKSDISVSDEAGSEEEIAVEGQQARDSGKEQSSEPLTVDTSNDAGPA